MSIESTAGQFRPRSEYIADTDGPAAALLAEAQAAYTEHAPEYGQDSAVHMVAFDGDSVSIHEVEFRLYPPKPQPEATIARSGLRRFMSRQRQTAAPTPPQSTIVTCYGLNLSTDEPNKVVRLLVEHVCGQASVTGHYRTFTPEGNADQPLTADQLAAFTELARLRIGDGLPRLREDYLEEAQDRACSRIEGREADEAYGATAQLLLDRMDVDEVELADPQAETESYDLAEYYIRGRATPLSHLQLRITRASIVHELNAAFDDAKYLRGRKVELRARFQPGQLDHVPGVRQGLALEVCIERIHEPETGRILRTRVSYQQAEPGRYPEYVALEPAERAYINDVTAAQLAA